MNEIENELVKLIYPNQSLFKLNTVLDELSKAANSLEKINEKVSAEVLTTIIEDIAKKIK